MFQEGAPHWSLLRTFVLGTVLPKTVLKYPGLQALTSRAHLKISQHFNIFGIFQERETSPKRKSSGWISRGHPLNIGGTPRAKSFGQTLETLEKSAFWCGPPSPEGAGVHHGMTPLLQNSDGRFQTDFVACKRYLQNLWTLGSEHISWTTTTIFISKLIVVLSMCYCRGRRGGHVQHLGKVVETAVWRNEAVIKDVFGVSSSLRRECSENFRHTMVGQGEVRA